MSAETSRAIPLGEYLARNLPPRTMPPGELISYSNHGYALAGYLVEVVSGVAFADYMEENVLAPLGMTRSSFHQPLSPALAAELATGYEYLDGTFEARPSDFVHDAPAGALAMTASDAARFLIAHLQKGRLGDVRILQESTVEEMHRRQFANHPRFTGIGYGFWERVDDGRRALAHDGGSFDGFYALMYILPDENAGVFVAANSFDLFSSGGLGDDLAAKLVDRFFPTPEASAEPPSTHVRASPSALEGAYRGLRIPPQSTFEKVLNIVLQIPVWSNPDDTLTLHMPLSEESTWHEVEPLLYREAGGASYIAFRKDSSGEIRHLVMTSNVWEKLPWYDLLEVQLPLLGVLTVVFVAAPAGWLVRARRGPTVARLLAGFVCVLNVAFLIGLGLLFADYPRSIVRGMPPFGVVLFVLPILSAAVTLLCVVFTIREWRRGEGSIGDSVVVGAALVFLVFLHHFHLLGFRF